MRKIIVGLAVVIAVILAGAEILLPSVVTGLLKHAIVNQTGASDIALSLRTTPSMRMLLGDMDEIHGVMHGGRVGNVFVRELSIEASGARMAMVTLLREGRTHLLRVDEVELRGIIDEESVKALISEKTDKFSNVEVKITPEGVNATADAKLLGRTFALNLEGQFIVESGDLYFKAKKISASGGGLGKLSVGSLFDDILVARGSQLPFELKFLSVTTQDGLAILTAGK